MAPTQTPQKKTKKAAENINSRLALTIKSGKVAFGYKSCLKNMRSGKGESLLHLTSTKPALLSAVRPSPARDEG
jgi:large subunit ribosomal protein L30e